MFVGLSVETRSRSGFWRVSLLNPSIQEQRGIRIEVLLPGWCAKKNAYFLQLLWRGLESCFGWVRIAGDVGPPATPSKLNGM